MVFCPKCGNEYEASFKFCPNCGEAKQGEVQQSEITPPPPVPPPPPPAQPPGGYYSQQSYYPPAPTPKKSRRKGLGCGGGILILIIIVIVVAVIISLSGNKETTTTTSQSSNTKFEEIGAFSPGGAFATNIMLGYSYYVANPTKSAIRQFCEEQKNERLQNLKDYNRILQISFFDDESHTPNFTGPEGYYFPDECEPYRVADYILNPSTGADEVTFTKEIPE